MGQFKWIHLKWRPFYNKWWKTGVYWYLIVALVCIFLKHLFICLFSTIWLFSPVKCAKVSGSIWNQVAVFLSLSLRALHTFQVQSFIRCVFSKYFSTVLRLVFSLSQPCGSERKILTVVISSASVLSVMNHAFSVVSKKLAENPSLLGCSVLVQFL